MERRPLPRHGRRIHCSLCHRRLRGEPPVSCGRGWRGCRWPAGDYGRRGGSFGGAAACASAGGAGGRDASRGPAFCDTASASITSPVGMGVQAAAGNAHIPAAPSPAATQSWNAAPRRRLRGAAARGHSGSGIAAAGTQHRRRRELPATPPHGVTGPFVA